MKILTISNLQLRTFKGVYYWTNQLSVWRLYRKYFDHISTDKRLLKTSVLMILDN